jgi:hypothetical protein
MIAESKNLKKILTSLLNFIMLWTLLLMLSCKGEISLKTPPSTPTSLSLVTPGSLPGLDPRPTINVSGVVSGDTIKLFSDSACNIEIGSAIASGTSIDITVSSDLPVSTHSIYANASNNNGPSPCSSSSVTYTLASCPAGYVPVPYNSVYGTTRDFCVMKYEAKNNGSGVAVSQAPGVPFGSVSQINAKAYCTQLNTVHGVDSKYDLISNPEWMTMAIDIEKTTSNWSSGKVGEGSLNRGHCDNNPTTICDATVENVQTDCLTLDPDPTKHHQKRTHTLSNGQIIWDLAGNVWEHIDWSLGGDLTSSPSCPGGERDLPSVGCTALAPLDYLPANPGGVTAEEYDRDYGLGNYYGGSGGAARRGGNRTIGPFGAGIFSLHINETPTSGATSTTFGFRCVYRP